MDGHASIETWKYEDSPDGRYTLAYGNDPGNWVWVRLRKKARAKRLPTDGSKARSPTNPRVGDRVYYSQYDEDRPMYLPPTWL
jgi:hypothetical protein